MTNREPVLLIDKWEEEEFQEALKLLCLRFGIIEDADPEPEPVDAVSNWDDVLDTVDWLAVVRDIQTADLQFWPDFCAKVATALYSLDLSASKSLSLVVEGLAMRFREHSHADPLHRGIDWAKWLTAIEAYLVKEDAEPGEYQGTTFAEFCEALAATMQNTRFGLHKWTPADMPEPASPSSAGKMPNAAKVLWYLGLLLWRVPEWKGEGLRAGEKSPREYQEGTGGGWSSAG